MVLHLHGKQAENTTDISYLGSVPFRAMYDPMTNMDSNYRDFRGDVPEVSTATSPLVPRGSGIEIIRTSKAK